MKRLLMLFALFTLLAAPALTHDLKHENPKRIHAIHVHGEACPEAGCYMTWFWVVISEMDANPKKKTPAGYRISWRLVGDEKWVKKEKNNRRNAGTTYIPHVRPDPYILVNDPHQSNMSHFITDQICVPYGESLEVRVRPVYNGAKNGPWTKDIDRAGDTGWSANWKGLPAHDPLCPGTSDTIGPVGRVDDNLLTPPAGPGGLDDTEPVNVEN